MGAFFEDLPEPWKTVCSKPHHTDAEDHTRKCYNWISPKGKKYQQWSEVQTYFQLMSFEQDIPGVECRPENAKRRLLEETGGSEGVTLEEDVKKEPEVKSAAKEVKRRRSTVAKNKVAEEANPEGEENPKPKKRGRKKKDEEDEEYVPESEKKKISPKEAEAKNVKSVPKSNILEQAVKEATLDEISEAVVEDMDTKQILANHKIPEGLKIVNIEQPTVKVVETPKTKPSEAKPSAAQSLSKATITPVPAQPTKSVNSTPSAKMSAQVTKTPEVTKSVSTPSSNTSGATPRGISRPGAQPQIRTPGHVSTPGQARVRPVSSVSTPTSGASIRHATPRAGNGTPMTPRAVTPGLRPPVSGTPVRPQATRVPTPQQRQQRPQTPGQQGQLTPVARNGGVSRIGGLSELPPSLRGQVKFPCKVDTCAPGGGSLYRAAAGHLKLGQEGWLALRRYCHGKMLEWWQWYQPYYTFPCQVRISIRNQTSSRRIPSASEFVKFLKTDESLHSFYVSECELYCLANILGIPLNLLTWSGQGAAGSKWDTYEPHQSLIHQNKFDCSSGDKQPLYLLHEKDKMFSRLVKQ